LILSQVCFTLVPTHANAVVDQEQQMNELGMTVSQTVFCLVLIAVTFTIGYAVGFNSGKDEGQRQGFQRAKNIYLKRGE
jgi:hypothetical protein